MRNRLFTALALITVVVSAFGVSLARKSDEDGNGLAKLLPSSDGVVMLDSTRLFSTALPQILSANQPMLKKLMGKLDQIEADTGLDLREFSDVAVGIKGAETAENKISFEPVLLARGKVDAKALIAVARLASDGKYHSEKVGDRTIYIFSPERIIEKNKPKNDPKKEKSFLDKAVDKMFKGLSREIALTVYDENTVALGTLARVKETISDSPRISDSVLNLLNRKPTAIGSFGMMLPNGISKYVKLGDDELGETLDSIRQLQGAMDVNDGKAVLSLMANTEAEDQAANLEATLMGFQMLGKAIFENSKGADKEIYYRMVKNATIAREATAVMLDLNVPQSDIDVLVSKK